MSENEGDLGAFLAGFVLGGLAGAAAALIMAPQSGEETRAQMVAKGDEFRRAGEAQLHGYAEAAGTAYSGAQERARIVLDEGKSKLGAARGNAQKDDSPAVEEAGDNDEAADLAS